MPRLHQVNPTTAESPTATSTPVTTAATRRTALRTVWYRETRATSMAVRGASTGRGVLDGSASAIRYANTAVPASRAMVSAVGWARYRTTVRVSGARWATVRAAAPIRRARRLPRAGTLTAGGSSGRPPRSTGWRLRWVSSDYGSAVARTAESGLVMFPGDPLSAAAGDHRRGPDLQRDG